MWPAVRSVWSVDLRSSFVVVFCALFLQSCGSDPTSPAPAPLIPQPAGFPAQTFPDDNQPNADRVALGKKLFFDPILSRDLTVSCATCHVPALAFADTVAVTPGVEGRRGIRNAPSLINVAYQPYFMREGGVPTLEMQVLVPIQEHAEMDMNILDVAERLKAVPEYVSMSQKAYGRDPDPFVITRALAMFERTLIGGTSIYDRVKNNEYGTSMSSSAQRGMALFFSDRTSCSSCHGGFLFTDHRFANNGLYEEYADNGRERLTYDQADRALFKVPSLRNVGVTPPYMHNGAFNTLDDVLQHYNSGGKNHPHKHELIRPLYLTQQELMDLKNFLLALTDV